MRFSLWWSSGYIFGCCLDSVSGGVNFCYINGEYFVSFQKYKREICNECFSKSSKNPPFRAKFHSHCIVRSVRMVLIHENLCRYIHESALNLFFFLFSSDRQRVTINIVSKWWISMEKKEIMGLVDNLTQDAHASFLCESSFKRDVILVKIMIIIFCLFIFVEFLC